ncbi:MAG: cytochrome D1 domain-containing protein [Candidatus Eremiobacterota bacterium]
MRRGLTRFGFGLILAAAPLAAGCNEDNANNNGGNNNVNAIIARFASRSGTIQIRDNDEVLFVLNPGTISSRGSLSVFQVRDAQGNDVSNKLGEVQVGNFPESVSVSPDGSRAYVSNGADSTVSVIDVTNLRVLTTINVGSEPRGTALSPTGRFLYVTSFSNGTLAVIDTTTNTVVTQAALNDPNGGRIENPYAVLCTNDGDSQDNDETVYVTDFYARPVPGLTVDQIETFNNGKEGHVGIFNTGTNTVLGTLVLPPIDSGFTANRTQFASPPAVFPTYAAPAGVPVNAVPQFAFFNQLFSLCDNPSTGRVYVTAIAASPEPPVNFNTNVQAYVGVFDRNTNVVQAAEHVNLNNLIRVEPQPAAPFNSDLTRAFCGDLVDVCVRGGTAIFLSRAGSYALRGRFDANGRITLENGANTAAVRIPVGSIPSGVCMSSTGGRAYVNSRVNMTFQTIDVNGGTRIGAEVASTDLPAVGSQAHNALIGELIFFTGMGTPANGINNGNVRNLNTHQFRGIASDNNWSSCGSCHPFGLADGVTWSFPTGPRQTLPLDGTHTAAGAQKSLNWNSVRSSVSDFNNNTRNVQGGFGFTPQAVATLNAGGAINTVPDAGTIFNHSTRNPTEAFQLMDLWIQVAVRTLNRPSNLDAARVAAGRTAFVAGTCNTCHGTDLWSSSRVRWNLPLFDKAPDNATPPPPVLLDPRVQLAGAPGTAGANVVRNFDANADGVFETPIVTQFGGASPTLNLGNGIEMRGTGGLIGQPSVGAAGSFNPPSLLGANSSGPYGHHGRARTLADVFVPIANGGLGHPSLGLSAQQLSDVAEFLRSIDAAEPAL